MMSSKDLGPDNRSTAYDRMAPRWAIMNALLGGTEAMRAAGEDRLPKHPEESDNSWRNRLSRATLLNMTEITLDMLVGKPFTEPVQLEEDEGGSTEFHEWAEDIDLQGNNIDVFARRWFRDGMAKGLSHLLVDMPRKTATEGPRTLADDAADGIRPYFVHIPAESVIFMSGTMVGGREVLDHVRIAEAELIRDGWGERVVQRIRVLEPGKVMIWELTKIKNRKDQWKLVDEWATDLDYIPLVTFYTDREELGVAKPPLLDLAYMNVHHWQLDADLNNIISVACFPMLAMSGVDNTEAGGDGGLMRLGPNQILATRSEHGKFYYVEHTGAAITTGMNKLKHIEQQMSSYGAQFLKDRPGDVKATTRALDSAEALSQLQAITLSFKDALEMGLHIMADWVGADKAPSVEMSVDFGLNDPNEVGWAAIDAARQRRDISRATYLREMQRRGWLSDEYDADEDQQLLELEAQDMIQGAEAEANAQLERDIQLKQAGAEPPEPKPPSE
jgi:hypothetical protein